MRLKRWAAVTFLFSIVLMASWPLVLGRIPKGASQHEMAVYAIRAQIYIAVVLLAWFITAVLAVFVMRAAREEYLRGSAEALRLLIEGTLDDHKKKADGDHVHD